MHSNEYEEAFGRFWSGRNMRRRRMHCFRWCGRRFRPGGWLQAARKALLCGCLRCCGQRTSGKNHKTSCVSTAPRKCANAGAGSFCASFPVAPQGRGNGTFLVFAMLLHSKKTPLLCSRGVFDRRNYALPAQPRTSTSLWRTSSLMLARAGLRYSRGSNLSGCSLKN